MMNTIDPSNYSTYPTMVHLLKARAEAHPDKVAIRFLPSGEEETLTITYRQLNENTLWKRVVRVIEFF